MAMGLEVVELLRGSLLRWMHFHFATAYRTSLGFRRRICGRMRQKIANLGPQSLLLHQEGVVEIHHSITPSLHHSITPSLPAREITKLDDAGFKDAAEVSLKASNSPDITPNAIPLRPRKLVDVVWGDGLC
jgi:hypothetical protein